jgi:hypothetical protein
LHLVASRPLVVRGVVAFLPAIIATGLIAYAAWPGHMSADSLSMIGQTDTANYTNQLAPLLTALWHPLYELGAGPGYILVGQILTLALAVFALLRHAAHPGVAGVATAILLILPPTLSLVIFLSRDMWFAALSTAAIAAISYGTGRGYKPPTRLAVLGLALFLLVLAHAARQNAIFAVFGITLVTAWLLTAPKSTIGRAPLTKFVASVFSAVVVTALVAMANVVALGFVKPRDVNPEQALYVYDLAVISVDQRELLLPKRSNLQTLDDLVNQYSPDSPDGLLFQPRAAFSFPVTQDTLNELRGRWLDTITKRPLQYVEARAEYLLRLLGVTRKPNWVTHPGIDPNDQGLYIHFPAAHGILMSYLSTFSNEFNEGRIVYAPWLWLVLAGVATVLARKKLAGAPGAAVALLWAASASYALSLLATDPTTQYRLAAPINVWVISICAISGLVIARSRSAPKRAAGRTRADETKLGIIPVRESGVRA